jgi:hypothetical protein
VEYLAGAGQPTLEFAAAAIRVLRDASLDVPDDVSVISFDDPTRGLPCIQTDDYAAAFARYGKNCSANFVAAAPRIWQLSDIVCRPTRADNLQNNRGRQSEAPTLENLN